MSFQVIHQDPHCGPDARLPLVDSLHVFEPLRYFPLVDDPRVLDRTYVIGMTVLRPEKLDWTSPVARSLYDVEGWIYSVKGIEGGSFIAALNFLDGYRLALQYGISDAVIVGGGTVAAEGVDMPAKDAAPRKQGFLWQPYWPAKWDQVQYVFRACGIDFAEVIAQQRRLLHQRGFLSSRPFPAQVVVARTGGAAREGSRDILDARIFQKKLDIDVPPIETLIVTSKAGKASLKGRMARRHDIRRPTIIAESPAGREDQIDYPRALRRLREAHDIRIANHDGGPASLFAFGRAGLLDQLNLTLGRKRSIDDLLQSRVGGRKVRPKTLKVARRFFGGNPGGRIPRCLKHICISTDAGDEVVIVTFDGRTRSAYQAMLS